MQNREIDEKVGFKLEGSRQRARGKDERNPNLHHRPFDRRRNDEILDLNGNLSKNVERKRAEDE